MDKSDTCRLIDKEYVQNNIGVYEEMEIKREVLCHVDSVTRSEWFEGAKNSMKPELRITMFRYDYQSEKYLEYESEIYKIYRTYRDKNDDIQLYVEKRVNTDGN